MADLSLLLEAEKRGILPEDKKSLLEEARARGLVPTQEGAAPTVLQATAKRSYSAADVLPAAASNFVGSGAEFFRGVGHMIMNPLDTAKGLVDIGAGAIQNVLPKSVVGAVDTTVANLKPSPSVATSAAKAIAPISPGASSLLLSFATPESGSSKQAVQAANAAGGFFKDRYGSWEGIKRTLAEDPVGAIADLSSLLGISGAAATKVAAVSKPAVLSGLIQGKGSLAAKVATAAAPVVGGLDTTGKVLSAVGKYTDPLLPAAAAVQYAGPAVGAVGGKIKDVFAPSGLKDKALANALENNVQLMDEAIKLLGQGKTIEEVAVALKSPGLASFVQESSDVNSAVQRLYNARREAISNRQTKVLTAAETQVRQQNEAAQQQATVGLEAALPVATASPTAPRRAVKQALAGEAATLEGRQAAMTSQLTAKQQAAEAALAAQRQGVEGGIANVSQLQTGEALAAATKAIEDATKKTVTGPAYDAAFAAAPKATIQLDSLASVAKGQLGEVLTQIKGLAPNASVLLEKYGPRQVESMIQGVPVKTMQSAKPVTLAEANEIRQAINIDLASLKGSQESGANIARARLMELKSALDKSIKNDVPKEAFDLFENANKLFKDRIVDVFRTGQPANLGRTSTLNQPMLLPGDIVSKTMASEGDALQFLKVFKQDPAAMQSLKKGVEDLYRQQVLAGGKAATPEAHTAFMSTNERQLAALDNAGLGMSTRLNQIGGQVKGLAAAETALTAQGKTIPNKVAEAFKAEDEALKLASTTLGYKQTDKLREAIVRDPMVADMALTRMDAPARSSLARGVLQDAIKSGDANSILKHLDSNEQGIMRVLNAYDPKTAKATFAEMQKQANLLKLAEETGNQLKKVPTDNALTTAKKLNDLTSGMPEVQKEVVKIQAELARGETFKQLAAQGNMSAKRLFSDELRPRMLPLNQVMSIVNNLLTRLEGKLNEKLAVEIATELASSNKAAEAIAAAKKQQLSKGATSKSIANAMVNPATLPAVQITNAMAEAQ